MIVSPLDYELYSRVTGQPIPMSAAERMKMAPVVNEFTKNYTKAQNRQAMGRNILKIGALGALGVIGARALGTPSQETGQNLVENSTASNLVQKAADNLAATTATNTISQSLSTNQTPEQTLENAAETSTPPSQLNINESVEASVKKPTPNIDAAIERRSVKLPSATTIREKYNRYESTPQKQQKGLEETLVGGGSIYVSDREGKVGETIKTEAVSGFDDKGRSILNKFVEDLTSDESKRDALYKGDMETITSLTGQNKELRPDFENVLVSDTTDPQDASLYGAFATPLASPLAGHPDIPPGEDDIFQHGGTNTSPTTSLAYVDPKRVMAMSMAISEGKIKQPLTPEEKLVVAAEVEKKRTPNLLEQRAIDNKSAMDSMRLSDEERKKESIRLGSTGGIPNKTDMAEIRKSPEFKAAQESMKPKSTTEKVDEFTSKIMPKEKSSFVESMSMDLSADKTPTATFNLEQKDGGTKPYSVEISTPMAVSLNEMAEDGSLPEESFGKLFNLAKKSIKDKSGMAFGIDQ